jgi:hypothetical protein
MRSRWIRLLGAVLLFLGLGIAAFTTSGGVAHASNPVPYPSALSNHPYGTGWTGAQLKSDWSDDASNSPGNCTSPNTGEISTSGNDISLTTSGDSGDCVYEQSPHTYPTADGYVYEVYADFSNWTQWDSFWGYGNNWPGDGEIDAVEGGPGTNYVSWHDSTTPPDGYSNCNSNNGCDSSMAAITTPSNTNTLTDISPGWHYIDFAFGTDGAGKGAVSVWYDGTEVAYVAGTNVLAGGSQDDPFWIVLDTGSCDSANNGSVCNAQQPPDPGSVTAAYLRVFT